ncbi:MAG: DUF1926 domain-containing protein [Thermoguttaceae bacterium]|nr:DUF1926 domain-containing protein [Thermoguttaceae bacterium]MDW8077997.1 DUF1926 domain-containing protein [Thermoguttaceae bacterium]
MFRPVRLVLLIHNHQPVGNFDHVFEDAYQRSYLPFLEVFERFPPLRISLHISGPLFEWLEQHHPDYIDRLAALVRAGRIEIIGGAFYEPILAMIPTHDRIGQIAAYREFLEERFQTTVRGMWVAERVWEQSFTRDIVDAGIRYTVLDDFHFKTAGLEEDELFGHFVTEDEGRILSIFPGSERLRYSIPFREPAETLAYLRHAGERHPKAVVVFGDDGEKFGTWPMTYKHVYQDKWLERFFTALLENADWLEVCTLGEAFQAVPPMGRIFLPDCSYREMTEWALPPKRQLELEHLGHELGAASQWARLRPFIRGGFWRNFRVKYPESNEMYSRMLGISRRLMELSTKAMPPERKEWLHRARRELYRGQCNCAYWHGAFGGIYLPHLRHAVYRQLILAEQCLDQAEGKPEAWVEDGVEDFNFDARPEVRLANDKLVLYVAPVVGGHIYEMDVRSVHHNLLGTMTRRPEGYHHKVLKRAEQQAGQVASIHDIVVFKQEGLDKAIVYDQYPRKALVDLFLPAGLRAETLANQQFEQLGDFATGEYQAKIQRRADRVRLTMTREGSVSGQVIRLTKAITLSAGSPVVEVAYLLENLPPECPWEFAVELNFAGLPPGVPDRFYRNGDGQILGDLSTVLSLPHQTEISVVDQWLGLDLTLRTSRPAGLWTYPVGTVNGSEAGFELVYQSVAVVPHWRVLPDSAGRWLVTLELAVQTAQASERCENGALVTSSS